MLIHVKKILRCLAAEIVLRAFAGVIYIFFGGFRLEMETTFKNRQLDKDGVEGTQKGGWKRQSTDKFYLFSRLAQCQGTAQ